MELLGQKALHAGIALRLQVVGGIAMMLGYSARVRTRDVDVVLLRVHREEVLAFAAEIAAEMDWPVNWLNDDAMSTMWGSSTGRELLSVPGLTLEMPSEVQLLASKLAAFRDDRDGNDARVILNALRAARPELTEESLWRELFGHVSKENEKWARRSLKITWSGEEGAQIDGTA